MLKDVLKCVAGRTESPCIAGGEVWCSEDGVLSAAMITEVLKCNNSDSPDHSHQNHPVPHSYAPQVDQQKVQSKVEARMLFLSRLR